MAYEYKVVPAPVKGVKARGVKAGAGRFAHALETVMNDFAKDGWEYQRTDTLPCEEREGLMGKTTVFQNMLVFRRTVEMAAEEPAPETKALPAPDSEPEVAPEAKPEILDADTTTEADAQRVAAE